MSGNTWQGSAWKVALKVNIFKTKRQKEIDKTYQKRICILEVHGSEACGEPRYVVPEPTICLSPKCLDGHLATEYN